MEYSNRDWPEDFNYENGCYSCKCLTCKNRFLGHKRRLTCKVCEETREFRKELVDVLVIVAMEWSDENYELSTRVEVGDRMRVLLDQLTTYDITRRVWTKEDVEESKKAEKYFNGIFDFCRTCNGTGIVTKTIVHDPSPTTGSCTISSHSCPDCIGPVTSTFS